MSFRSFLSILFVSVCFGSIVSAALNLKVIIRQSINVIDANPIINFSEIQFWYNSVLQMVPSTFYTWSTESSNYGTELCLDAITSTVPAGGGTPNMCKSGNDLPEQTVVISSGSIPFNQIKIFNAIGFNNPGGQDVGKRIQGATLSVVDANNNNAVLFTYVFPQTLQSTFDISIPYLTAQPSAKPVTFAPSLTKRPTVVPSLSAPSFKEEKVVEKSEKAVDFDDQPWVPPTKAQKPEKAHDYDDQPWVPPKAASGAKI